MLIRQRGNIIDKISDAGKRLEDVNQELYELYETLGIKAYKYKGKDYRVQRQTSHNWNMKGLRKFLRNTFDSETVDNVIYFEEVEPKEKIDEDVLYKLIDEIKGKKKKEKFTRQLAKLVDVNEGKKFIKIYGSK